MRQRGLEQIIRLLKGELWETSDPHYSDALQQTWIYFCRNLCEATTGRAYDSEVCKLTTWLNAYLKRRLQDFMIAENHHKATTALQSTASTDVQANSIDSVPSQPDVPPWLDQVRAWAEADDEGTLKSVHISKHPDITAQMLILKRLPPETPWKTIAVETGISVGTLSSFYQRQCLTRLQAFGRSRGYF